MLRIIFAISVAPAEPGRFKGTDGKTRDDAPFVDLTAKATIIQTTDDNENDKVLAEVTGEPQRAARYDSKARNHRGLARKDYEAAERRAQDSAYAALLAAAPQYFDGDTLRSDLNLTDGGEE